MGGGSVHCVMGEGVGGVHAHCVMGEGVGECACELCDGCEVLDT